MVAPRDGHAAGALGARYRRFKPHSYFPQNVGVRVEVRNRRGKAVLNLKDVPLELMEQIAALLPAAVRQPRAA